MTDGHDFEASEQQRRYTGAKSGRVEQTTVPSVVPVFESDGEAQVGSHAVNEAQSATGWTEPDLPDADEVQPVGAAPVPADPATTTVFARDGRLGQERAPSIGEPSIPGPFVPRGGSRAATQPGPLSLQFAEPNAPSPQFGRHQHQAPLERRPAGTLGYQYQHPGPPQQAAFGPKLGPQQPLARPNVEGQAAPMSTATSSFRAQVRPTETSARVTGWRAWARRTGVNLGPSKADLAHADLIHRIRVPKSKFHVTSVFSDSAGGTLLVGVLGQILERTRADNVVGLDLDPDGGDLDQVTAWHQGGSTARTLIQQSDLSDRNQVDKHLAVTTTNLHVLPTPWRFDGTDVADYDDVLDLYSIFRPHYSLALVDGGRGLQTPTGSGVLEISSALILPASATTRGVRKVAATIDWLRYHGWHGLLANTIVVINHTKKKGSVTIEQFDELFRAGQKLRVHEIPYDPSLDADVPIDLDALKPRTIEAYEVLAAELADYFNSGYEPPAATKLAELQSTPHGGR